MSFKAILVQGHIPSSVDPQGNLTPEQKLEMFDLSLEHLRYHNPDTFIALTGHGDLRPKNVTLTDWFHWDKAWPINAAGLVIGEPAQRRWLGIGMQHLKKRGFDCALKTRLDCLIGRQNIVQWCQNILAEEDKSFLITQMTGHPGFLGDCFFYGGTEALEYTWHPDHQVVHTDGLVQTAHFFRAYHQNTQDWKSFLKSVCSFRDVWEIPFMDLRWNWHKLNNERPNWKNEIFMPGNQIYKQYSWGKINGWHIFNDQGKMITNSRPEMWSKETFYA